MKTLVKRDAILREGRALFLRYGIRKVRVEEVCADAQVSKRTFYKYFRNKDGLAVACLRELYGQSRAQLEEVLSLDCAFEEKVRRIMSVKSFLASETSAAFYREALDGTTEPGRYALREQRKWDERVRLFYIDSQNRGQIRDDIDVDVLMILLARIRDISREPEFVRLVPDFARLVEMVMTLLFYGLVPRTATDNRSLPRQKMRRKS